jgi:(2S)-methylsuccinyl-CoA dehydrogenase
MSDPVSEKTIEDARALVAATTRLTDLALARATMLTQQGKLIDDHQVVVDRVAYAATEARASAELLRAADAAQGDKLLTSLAIAASADLFRSVRDRLEPVASDLNLTDEVNGAANSVRAPLLRAGHESVVRDNGRAVAELDGKANWPLDSSVVEVRNSVRQFAEREVAPRAEHIHRHDELIPESFIQAMG